MNLVINHLSKSYGSLKVLSNLTLTFTGPGIYCLMAPSGAGKTTLFRLILGLEKLDAGEISPAMSFRFSAVFQDSRLIEHMTPAENIGLALGISKRGGGMEPIRRELAKLLPEESISRPVSTLSGGMRRRLSFLRAMMADSDIVLMDEPFTGLDEANKSLVIRYLLEHRGKRLFLISTHDPEDVKKLGAVLVTLPTSSDNLSGCSGI